MCGQDMPRAGMVMRGSGTRSKLRARGSLDATGFPDPDLFDHLPIRVIALLTSPTLSPQRSAGRAGWISVIFFAHKHGPDHACHPMPGRACRRHVSKGLLASAMATSMRGFRFSIRASHDPGLPPSRPLQWTIDFAPTINRRRMSRCPIYCPAGPCNAWSRKGSRSGPASACRHSNAVAAQGQARPHSRAFVGTHRCPVRRR